MRKKHPGRVCRDAADFRLIEEKRLDVYMYPSPPTRTRRRWCAWEPGADNDLEGEGFSLHAALSALRRAKGWR